MKRHCANCQKETDLEKEIYYTIADNFDKYGGIMWCSNCLKAVQKICEEKWGVNKDCLFGENNEQVHKNGRRIDKDDSYMVICPWCEVQFRWGNSLDHYYHFHGKDKGKCNKNDHKTEEEIKQMENLGPEFKDVRKVFHVDNGNDDNREREQNWGTEEANWDIRGNC